jgi:hypothetical protein
MLVGTALTFMIPCIVAYTVKQYAISLCCLLILISSVAFHQNPTHVTYWTDQLILVLFVLVAGSIIFKKSPYILLAIAGFLAYAYLIFYGPLESVCAYHPDRTVASLWHGTLHIIPACGLTAFLYA